VGARGSGATVKVFKHNDPANLERVLRTSIAQGQPRTHRPWRKIVIFVEGIYSMEGEMCRLAEIVELKKKYKAYLYLDEAHSIGAMGRHGRGICEHLNVDPADIDVMMGTFTKSFGAVGGYVASSLAVIDHVRRVSSTSNYASAMAAPCVVQVLKVIDILEGRDGTDRGAQKIQSLRRNARVFRAGLRQLGCESVGDEDSPVVPVMLYNPSKMPAFSRECLKRNVAVVVVGFPATPLITSRVRFCISAAHTEQDIIEALRVIDEVASRVMIKYRCEGHLDLPALGLQEDTEGKEAK
jgi:serine palmitoyltransferase